MNLSEILREESINLTLQSRTKTEVIRELAQLAAQGGKVADVENLIQAVMDRENIQTTGIGHNMAIPHATAEGVKGLILVLGISREGLDFEALDGEPVHLIFLLAGEPRLQTSFLSILSKISRFFRKDEFRQQVMQAGSAAEIVQLIQSREE